MGIETKRKKCERGSTLVEFALTILPLLALLMMTLDVAWVIFAWASIHEAVRAGVRQAITGQVPAGYNGQDAYVQAVVQQHSFGFVNAGNIASVVKIYYYSPNTMTDITSQPNSNAGGNVVKIAIQGIAINPMAPLWRSSSSLTLSASSSDVMEPTPNGPPQR